MCVCVVLALRKTQLEFPSGQLLAATSGQSQRQKVGKAMNVNFVYKTSFHTHSHMPLYPLSRQPRGITRVQERISVWGKAVCKAGLVKGVAWGVWLRSAWGLSTVQGARQRDLGATFGAHAWDPLSLTFFFIYFQNRQISICASNCLEQWFPTGGPQNPGSLCNPPSGSMAPFT